MAEARGILVTDAGLGSAISIIRSLGRHGWRVVAGDTNRGSLGFRSRYVAERLVYPSPMTDPAGFVRSVVRAVSDHGIDLIIPVTDATILTLSGDRAEVVRHCQVAMPDADALHAVTDKDRTLGLALELGIPSPRSVMARSAGEAIASASGFGWPVVLKPRSSRIYRERRSVEAFVVSYANSPDDIRARFHSLEGRCDVLVQEYCAGVGYGVGLLMHEGRPLEAFQHRRLHEVPLTGGASSLRESVALDPHLYQHAVRLLGAIRWTGLAMVEFKVGRSGPVLMEVNGRVWGSLPLAVRSGVDFPRLLAELYLVGPPARRTEPWVRYRVGLRARNLELDAVWIATALSGHRKYPFLSTPGRGRGLVGILELLDPRCRCDLLTMDDPGPGLAEIPKLARTLWQKVHTAVKSEGPPEARTT